MLAVQHCFQMAIASWWLCVSSMLVNEIAPCEFWLLLGHPFCWGEIKENPVYLTKDRTTFSQLNFYYFVPGIQNMKIPLVLSYKIHINYRFKGKKEQELGIPGFWQELDMPGFQTWAKSATVPGCQWSLNRWLVRCMSSTYLKEMQVRLAGE